MLPQALLWPGKLPKTGKTVSEFPWPP